MNKKKDKKKQHFNPFIKEVVLTIIQRERYQYNFLTKNIQIAEKQFKNGEFIESKDFVFDVDTIISKRE